MLTTPPPETQAQSETLEQIATKVVNQIAVGAWQYCSRQWVIGLVTEALRNERERAIRILNDHQALDKCEDNCWTTIKAQGRTVTKMSENDLVGNELFDRLQSLQGRELDAALKTVRRLRNNVAVTDGDLVDALYAFAIRLDVASPLLPVCHEVLKRFMRYGGMTETPKGMKREWLEQCTNPNCIDGKISVGCAVDGPLLTSKCPDCSRGNKDAE